MILNKFFVLLFLFFFCDAYSQISNKDKKGIETFVFSYNSKNYKLLRKSLFLPGRLILSESKIQEAFREVRRNFGNLTIADIIQLDKKNYDVTFVSERDSTEIEIFNFKLNKRGKIISFFKRNTPLNFTNNEGVFTIEQKALLIDSLMAYKYNKGTFNGCIAVIDSGKIIYKNCFGFSNLELKKKLETSSTFYLASCSKQFTAMAIMLLVEAGKIKINDTVQRFFSNFPYYNVTIENLLTHTSGLPDYFDFMNKYWDKKKTAQNNDVINLMMRYKPKIYFKPGEDFDYSNTGYVILASIIEKVSGVSFSYFLDSAIFKPLGMKNSFVGGSSYEKNKEKENWVFGYVYSDSLQKYIIPDSQSEFTYIEYLNDIVGDGNINASLDDLIIWENAIHKNKIVSIETQNKINTNYKINSGKSVSYGYGLCINDSNIPIAYHSGGWPGYHNIIVRFLNLEKSIIILSNNEYPSYQQLAESIGKILLK